MVQNSLLDEKLLRFQRQGRIGFYLTAWAKGPRWWAGLGAASSDWIFSATARPAPRSFALPVRTLLCQLYCNAEDPVEGPAAARAHNRACAKLRVVSSWWARRIPHRWAWPWRPS